MDAARIILVGNLGREPHAKKEAGSGFPVPASEQQTATRHGGAIVARTPAQPEARFSNALRVMGFRVERSPAGGYFVSRFDMAAYCPDTTDLATLARRIAAGNKVLDTLRARAALGGHRLEAEQVIDGRARYRLERAGRVRFAATLTEVEALIVRQVQCYSS